MSNNSTTEKIKNDGLGKVIGNIGGDFPLVTINGYSFSERELNYFEIDCKYWIPSIVLTISLTNGVFLSKHFPKDGDLISVFVRSMNNLFKPIKTDFLITEISTSSSGDSEGNIMSMVFRGILNIPNFYADKTYYFKDKSSLEVLTELANKIGLGLASNETEMNDKMNWMSHNKNTALFLQDIVNHSYKDDNSFFDLWIDYYYNINFVNLNKNYSIPDNFEPLEGLTQGQNQTDYDSDHMAFQKTRNILTNAPESSYGNQYFKSYRLINNSGFINSIMGYKKKLNFYDQLLKEKINFELSPYKTSGAEKGKNVMLGRPNEDYYLDNIKEKWLGFQFSDNSEDDIPNVHNFWKLSYIQNIFNRTEINKLNIIISLPIANFNLYKGQVIPVMFMVQSDPERVKVAGNEEDKPKATGATIDRFLTGNYVIKGISLKWIKNTLPGSPTPGGSYKQEVIISRREWTFPNAPKIQYNDDPLNWSRDYAL